ncbi:MAG: TRAP transporter substrate-binding protein [Pseudomonadota bacterium]
MKRTRILAAILAAFTATSAWAEELKLASFVPPGHPMDQTVMTPMAEAFNAATGGSTTIKVFPAGELGKGPQQQYKRIATGVAEIAFILPGFTEQLFPVLTGYETPGLYPDGESATKAMWENMDEINSEVKEGVPLAVWSNNPTILITKDKAVRAPADLEGMKIRVANSKTAKVIEAWGGVPVNMPPTEAYQALSTGTVDGIYIDPAAFRAYKLHEVTDYATVNVPGSVSSFLIAINNASYDGLTDAEKQALADASGEALSLKASNAFKKAGQTGLDLAAEGGVELVTLTDDEVNAFHALSPFGATN